MLLNKITSKEKAIEFLDECVKNSGLTQLELSEHLKTKILDWRNQLKDASKLKLSDVEINKLIGISFLVEVGPNYYFDLLERHYCKPKRYD